MVPKVPVVVGADCIRSIVIKFEGRFYLMLLKVLSFPTLFAEASSWTEAVIATRSSSSSLATSSSSSTLVSSSVSSMVSRSGTQTSSSQGKPSHKGYSTVPMSVSPHGSESMSFTSSHTTTAQADTSWVTNPFSPTSSSFGASPSASMGMFMLASILYMYCNQMYWAKCC